MKHLARSRMWDHTPLHSVSLRTSGHTERDRTAVHSGLNASLEKVPCSSPSKTSLSSTTSLSCSQSFLKSLMRVFSSLVKFWKGSWARAALRGCTRVPQQLSALGGVGSALPDVEAWSGRDSRSADLPPSGKGGSFDVNRIDGFAE